MERPLKRLAHPVIGAFAAGFAAWSLCGAASADIRLGVGAPVTGPDATFGAQLRMGAEQAVADINAAGGILGQQISVEVGDDAADPKQGVSVANKFVGDQVAFVVGHFNSGVTIPASDVYAENNILQITPGSTNPQVTDRGIETVFRTCGRDDQQGAVAAKFLAAQPGKKIAIVHDKTTYGKGLADETKKSLNALGITEVLYEGVNKGEKDYSAVVSKIKESGADIVYWGGVHTEGGLLLRQMRDQGVNAVMMGGDGIASDEFAAIARAGRRRNLHDLSARSARPARGCKGRAGIQGEEFQSRDLYALFLRRGASAEAGGGSGQIARSRRRSRKPFIPA